MRKAEKINHDDIWFSTPTVSNEYTQTTPKTTETEFDISILDDDYRQNEFLNSNVLPQIEEDFKGIKEIWANHSKKNDEHTLFKIATLEKPLVRQT